MFFYGSFEHEFGICKRSRESSSARGMIRILTFRSYETEKDDIAVSVEIVQTSEEYEDNFAVDSSAAKEFAQKVKDAVAEKDLEALAELTAFPVYVGLPDVGVVENKEDFLKIENIIPFWNPPVSRLTFFWIISIILV